MRSEWRSSVVLAGSLLLLELIGNAIAGEPHRVSVFPALIALAAFPVAIYPAVRARAREGPVTRGQLRWTGWVVVWPAAIAFATFSEVLMIGRLARTSIAFAAIGFAGTLGATIVLGLLCTEACGLIVARRGAAAAAGPSGGADVG